MASVFEKVSRFGFVEFDFILGNLVLSNDCSSGCEIISSLFDFFEANFVDFDFISGTLREVESTFSGLMDIFLPPPFFPVVTEENLHVF